jgi:hypothetical protein
MPGSNGDAGDHERTGARLFAQLWDTLADVLGTAATAALLRRSLKRAAARHTELLELEIYRHGFSYEYKVPESWTAPGNESVAAVQDLARELWPILIERTGEVVVRRLARIPGLQAGPLSPSEAFR